jgi:hypothetical protein
MYLEHNPVPWASGFAVLTFRNGVLLPPELVEVIDGEAFFRPNFTGSLNGEKIGCQFSP